MMKEAFCLEENKNVNVYQAWLLSRKFPSYKIVCPDRKCGVPLVVYSNPPEMFFKTKYENQHTPLCECINKSSIANKIRFPYYNKKVLLDYFMYLHDKYQFYPSAIIQKLDEIDEYITYLVKKRNNGIKKNYITK